MHSFKRHVHCSLQYLQRLMFVNCITQILQKSFNSLISSMSKQLLIYLTETVYTKRKRFTNKRYKVLPDVLFICFLCEVNKIVKFEEKEIFFLVSSSLFFMLPLVIIVLFLYTHSNIAFAGNYSLYCIT